MIYMLEDDANIRNFVLYALNNSGLEAKGFERPSEFCAALKEETPSVLLLEQPISPEDVMRRIELCGRVCYKSEGKITFNSYKGFIQRIIKRGHEAVLEHGNLIIGMSKDSDGGSGVWFSALDRAFEQTGTASYIRKTHGNAQNIVSGNVRAWRDVLRVCAATNTRRGSLHLGSIRRTVFGFAWQCVLSR